jgi:hypothetical protein
MIMNQLLLYISTRNSVRRYRKHILELFLE